MYATHPTLVDNESQVFYDLGFDVYTAAWATNTRSNWHSSNIFLNPLHFYQGKCDFLSQDSIDILSKIEVSMCGTHTNNDVSKVICEEFDVLYVSQITPWLMNYAPQFLALGKPVIFRTFCYPLQAWGSPANYMDLYGYSNFYILPTHMREIVYGTFGSFPRVRYIMASVCKSLVNKCQSSNHDKFALTVVQFDEAAENSVKLLISSAIRLEMINRRVKFVPIDRYWYLYNACYMYIDLIDYLLRYSTFEALLYDKPIIVVKDGDMHKFMHDTGFVSSVECFYGGLSDVAKIKFYVDNSNALDELFACEKHWFDSRINEMKASWMALFSELGMI